MNNDNKLVLLLGILAASYSLQWSGIPFFFENPTFNCYDE